MIWFPEESRHERYNRLGLYCNCLEKQLADPKAVAAMERYRREQDDKTARSVVYYIRSQDLVKIGVTVDLAKIGVTVDLAKRMNMFNVPHIELLGTEPGDARLERQRHTEFAADRVQGEWFKLTDVIKAHIAGLTG